MPAETQLKDLVDAARLGDPRAVARLVSVVEDRSGQLRDAMRLLLPYSGDAHVVGVTGSPGVGKSTATSVVITCLREQGKRIGVLAIDPSSPFSGGALLGDRIRMQEHATDPDVFIRSMASRGHLGGLSWATPQAIRVFEVARCDVVLIETVGVGQSEIEVVGVADTVIVMVAPGMGDGVQAAKAGIFEIGDIFVVNKADRDGASATCRDMKHMISLAPRGPDDWSPPVLETVASEGKGMLELVTEIGKHLEWSRATGAFRQRRLRRAADEIEGIALAQLRARMGEVGGDSRVRKLAEQVVDRVVDPYSAADTLLEGL